MEHGEPYKLYERQISAQCEFDSHLLDHIEYQFFLFRKVNNKNCWLWTGYTDSSASYGGLYINSVQYRVSRLSAMLYLGLDINDSNTWVCHKCDSPRCFNPEHLYLGDASTNAQDRENRGRNSNSYRVKDTCKEGHAITSDNIYTQKGVGRSCLMCRREKARAYAKYKSNLRKKIIP